MPMPRWFARLNKHTFNKRELKRGVRPVLEHVGRSSGTAYEVPLDAHEIAGGYLFVVVYRSTSDWVRNVMAAESATLRINGAKVDLVNPRIVTKDAALAQLPQGTKTAPGFLRIDEYLQMDTGT